MTHFAGHQSLIVLATSAVDCCCYSWMLLFLKGSTTSFRHWPCGDGITSAGCHQPQAGGFTISLATGKTFNCFSDHWFILLGTVCSQALSQMLPLLLLSLMYRDSWWAPRGLPWSNCIILGVQVFGGHRCCCCCMLSALCCMHSTAALEFSRC